MTAFTVSSFSAGILARTGVASIEQAQRPRRSPAKLAEAARRLNHQTVALLPGAVAFVGFQLYALPRALPHLDNAGSVVMVLATLLSMASAVALLCLFRHARFARTAAGQQSLEARRFCLAGATSALLLGQLLMWQSPWP